MSVAVYCFSGAGHSLSVAKRIAERLNAPVCLIGQAAFYGAETAVIVFPVYCQNIPTPVRGFLHAVSAKYVVLIAAYGGISPGNVLREASDCVCGTVIAAAAVPTGHSFLSEPDGGENSFLSPIIERIYRPQKAEIPKLFKNPFSDFFPAWRSRVGVKITCSSQCNDCKICEINCPMHAMHNGRPDEKCIRCLRCIRLCPKGALRFTLRPAVKGYLRKKRKNRLYLFL